MPRGPAIYRPAGAAKTADLRTPLQIAYRRWYRRLPWTDGKRGGLRGEQLARQPLCEECEKEGWTTAATVVDHRVPHRGDWDRFIDEANHCSLCPHHHSVKTAKGQ